MRYLTIATLVFLALLFAALPVQASWLIYHKPAFQGQVVDINTKKPIEGAVVAVLYRKRTLGLGAGSISSVIKVRESVTDKAGIFQIPSYTTLIQPFSWTVGATFIIYKPGYACDGEIGLEKFLSGRATEKVELWFIGNNKLKFNYLPNGVIELPEVTTPDERETSRMRAMSFWPAVEPSSLPNLSRLLNVRR